MSNETLQEQTPVGDITNVKKFTELFDFINSQKLGEEYKEAYEEAADMAKNMVATKTKEEWNAKTFEDDFADKYPKIQKDFIRALKRCIENYNPPVNLPENSLW